MAVMIQPVILAVACMLFLVPAAAGADGDAPALLFHRPAEAGAGFRQFLTEYEGMVRSWWEHGGRRAARGRWHVTAMEAARPGIRQPHFIVTVALEQEGLSQLLVLTFEVPPHGQVNLFLASHAAYNATLGAILGEIRGRRRWDGGGPREMTHRHGAPLVERCFFFSPTTC